MTSLELIIGFLGVPTLGALLLVFLRRSESAMDRHTRENSRYVVGILGWIAIGHIGLFVLGGLYGLVNSSFDTGWPYIAMLARVLTIALLVIAGRTAITFFGFREGTADDPIPTQRRREQDDLTSQLFTTTLILISLPLFIPALIVLLPLSIFLLLEDIVFGINQQVRENRLLWTLALAVKHGRDLSEDISGHAMSLAADRQKRFWSWFLPQSRYELRLERMSGDLSAGMPLTNSLMNNPGLLSSEHVAVIAIAEKAGNLATVLPQHASRHSQRLDAQLSSESTYSIVLYCWCVLMVAMHLCTFLMYWIIPKFKDIFIGFDAELPPITLRLIDFGDVLYHYWSILLPLLALPTIVLFLLQRFASGNHRYFRWLLKWMPRLETPHLLTQLSYSIENGTEIGPQIQAIIDIERVPALRRRLEHLRDLVNSGVPIHEAMQQEGFINEREWESLESSVQLGHTPWVLQAIGRKIFLSRSNLFRWAMAVGEPLLMTAVGLLIGLFCVAMYTPVASLLTEISASVSP
ncbi:MAG: type II secretion system F family protein [Planctomycetaceae bacterium]|nr:type II secretion system F family protein [Planctomycetaceae bacterium]